MPLLSPVPDLNALWRPNDDSDVEDRELIRSYLGWPIANHNLIQISVAMNRAADTSPATVRKVQAWLDEAEELELTWADQVSDGTAHLGNVQSYQGPAPGTTLTRDDIKRKADVLEWDTSLLQVKFEAGGRADSTAGGVLAARIAQLRGRILQTLGLEPASPTGGGMTLVRS
jgi:hypothetical protein